MDEAAGELGLDPLELRRRNALREGYANTQGGPQGGYLRNLEMLDRAAAHPLWRDRAAAKAAHEAANPGRLYTPVVVPVGTAIGPARVVVPQRYECNPWHRYFPLTVITKFNVEVLP